MSSYSSVGQLLGSLGLDRHAPWSIYPSAGSDTKPVVYLGEQALLAHDRSTASLAPLVSAGPAGYPKPPAAWLIRMGQSLRRRLPRTILLAAAPAVLLTAMVLFGRPPRRRLSRAW